MITSAMFACPQQQFSISSKFSINLVFMPKTATHILSAWAVTAFKSVYSFLGLCGDVGKDKSQRFTVDV